MDFFISSISFYNEPKIKFTNEYKSRERVFKGFKASADILENKPCIQYSLIIGSSQFKTQAHLKK